MRDICAFRVSGTTHQTAVSQSEQLESPVTIQFNSIKFIQFQQQIHYKSTRPTGYRNSGNTLYKTLYTVSHTIPYIRHYTLYQTLHTISHTIH